MVYIKGGCQQFKSIIKLSAAIYASVLYAMVLGSAVDPENKIVKDLLFSVGCIFVLSSINMYYGSMQSESSTEATVFPESKFDEELAEVTEESPSFIEQSMVCMRLSSGGLSSAYRGGIASLLMTSNLGLTGSARTVGGIGFMLVFTLAKFPHFAGTSMTRNEWVLVPTRVISSLSSALIAFRLVPRFSPLVRLLSQCAFSASVFVIEYNSERRRVFSDQAISSWESSLIFGVSVFYSLIATPEEVSPFHEMNASNVVLYTASSVLLSWVFVRYYHYTIEPAVSRSTTPETELVSLPPSPDSEFVELPSPSPPFLGPSQSSVG